DRFRQHCSARQCGVFESGPVYLDSYWTLVQKMANRTVSEFNKRCCAKTEIKYLVLRGATSGGAARCSAANIASRGYDSCNSIPNSGAADGSRAQGVRFSVEVTAHLCHGRHRRRDGCS